jgi:biotin transport system substrate-specific component
MSYPFAAAAAGLIVRACGLRRSQFGPALLAGVAATVITFSCGATWIAHVSHLTGHTIAAIGVAPFLPGEVIKVIAAAGAFTTLRQYIRQ